MATPSLRKNRSASSGPTIIATHICGFLKRNWVGSCHFNQVELDKWTYPSSNNLKEISSFSSVGEEGEMIWENGIETCILPYVKEMTSPSLMHETGHSKPMHWDNPEGWEGEGGGRRAQDGRAGAVGWGDMYICGWFMSMYGKNHNNIVISLQLKKKKKKYQQLVELQVPEASFPF